MATRNTFSLHAMRNGAAEIQRGGILYSEGRQANQPDADVPRRCQRCGRPLAMLSSYQGVAKYRVKKWCRQACAQAAWQERKRGRTINLGNG